MSDTVDDYIQRFDGETKARLLIVQQIMRSEMPDTDESISYGMPAYKLNGRPVVYFAGYRSYIGLYATPNDHEEFADELAKYKHGKGSVQFPVNKPLPIDLIKRIAHFRRKQVAAYADSDKLPYISRPAVRALEQIGVTKASQLKRYTEKDLLTLHGVGPKTITLLKEANVRLKGL